MYQEFDYDVGKEMASLEDPGSACEVALSLLHSGSFWLFCAGTQLSAFSAEPGYSGDDVMLGCDEWLVGRGGLLLRPLLKQTDSTDRVFDRVWLFALRNCACL